MTRVVVLYVLTVAAFGSGIYVLLEVGSRLPPGRAVPDKRAARPAAGGPDAQTPDALPGAVAEGLRQHLRQPVCVLVLQVIVVVAAATLVGGLFRRLGQPAVIGEMVAGILLGPSLLGLLAPGTEAFLFPPPSLGSLKLISEVGVILFMFVVGLELDAHHFRNQAHAAVLVSHASIVVPFFLGTAFSLLIYPATAPADVPFYAFALFFGTAMSITAFPVLARILDDKGLTRTFVGTTATACAAVGDVTAWCILAAVVGIVGAGGFAPALATVGLSLLFIAVMLLVVKPLGSSFVGRDVRGTRGNKGFLAGVLVFVFGSALATEVIGIHALFGAFLAGVVMPPDNRLRAFLKDRVELFSSVFLLPLFFAFTGLRTQLGLLDDLEGWLMCAGVILVAIAGKLGGSMLAARWTGIGWRDSFAIGALMNTRGLMELIVLNLGYDLGILSARVFTMMVVMALVTTFMTGPLLLVLRTRQAPADLALAGEAAR
jgi:Kef-type K+ transport system membrane component KefB